MNPFHLGNRKPFLTGLLVLATALLISPSSSSLSYQTTDKDRETAAKLLCEPARQAMVAAGLTPEQPNKFGTLLIHNKFSNDNMERLECECHVHETLDLAKLDYPKFLEEKQKRYGYATVAKDAKEFVEVGGEEKAFVIDFGKYELTKGQSAKGEAWGWIRVGQVRISVHKTRNSKTASDPFNPPSAELKAENVKLNDSMRGDVIDLLKKLAGALKSPEQPEDDSFWKEFPNLCRFIRTRYHDYKAARAEAGCTGGCLRDLRRRMKLLNGTLFNEQGPSALSPEMQSRVRKKIGELGVEIGTQRRQMDTLQREADVAITDIRRRLQDLERKYGKKYPVVQGSLRHYQDLYDQIPLDFARAEGDEDSINSAVSQGKDLDYSATTRMEEAKELWMRGDTVQALFKMRQAREKESGNVDVKKALIAMECDFLRTSIWKSQSAVAAARNEFYKYMGDSGFAKHLKDGSFDGQSSAFTDVWAHFVTGVTRSWSGMRSADPNSKDPQSFFEELRRGGDRPDSEARTLEATETTMLKAFKGLQAILMLRRMGHEFKDIQKMGTTELQAKLPLRSTLPDKNPLGKPYSDDQMRLMGTYIREAMQLPDVKALMGPDPDALKKAVDESYWNPNDTGDTWAEWVGDLSSAVNVFMFFSGSAVAKAGNLSKIGYWGKAQQELVASLKAAQQVTYGSEVVNALPVLKRVMNAIGLKPGTSKAITAYMEKSLAYRYGTWAGQEATTAWKLAWTVNSAVGGMIIQYYAAELLKDTIGEEYAVPLTQAVMLFGPNTDSLLHFLKDTKLPPAQLSKSLNTLSKAAREESRQCQAAIKDIDELGKLFDKAIKEKSLSPEELKYLADKWGEGWKAKLRNGEIITDDIMTNAAIKANAARIAAEKGKKDGSVQALISVKKEIEEQGNSLAQMADDSAKAASRVLEPPPASVATASPIAKEMFLYKDPATGRLVWDVQPGSKIALAEAALREGEFEKAKTLFLEAAELFEKEARDLEMVILDKKIDFAVELIKLKEKGELAIPPGLPEYTKPITPDDLVAIQNGQWTRLGKQGTTSEVWQSGDFLVKKMNNQNPIGLGRSLEGEIVTADLAKLLELDVPPISTFVKDGETYIASRFIKGKDLADASAAEAFQHRDQIAQHNILSHLVGDFDRHGDNFRIGSDRRVYSLDAGNADVRAQVWPLKVYENPDGIKLMSDRWITQNTQSFGKGGIDDKPNALLHDLLLSNSPAVKEMTKRAQDLVKDESRLRSSLDASYRRIYGDKLDPTYVDQAVAGIKARAKSLDAITQGWNARNVGK